MSKIDQPRKARIIAALGEKYGFFCSYCSIPLVHDGNKHEICRYEPDEYFYDQCRCGKHDITVEPCLSPGGWSIVKQGYAWASIDHMIPRARGGGDNIENLCLCCKRCNSRKGALTSDEYRAKMEAR